MTKLTREEAVELIGESWVDEVERLNCEPTSRVYPHKDGEIEWMASIEIDGYDGLSEAQIERLPVGGCTLMAVYYTTREDSELVEENGGDWSGIDWTPDHYELY